MKTPAHPGYTCTELTAHPAGGGLLALWVLWSLVVFLGGVVVGVTVWERPIIMQEIRP